MSAAEIAYLDNNATTRVDPRVFDAMRPYLADFYGNPSSLHQFGAVVGAAIEEARGKIAAAIGAKPSEIVFCSGGTEADNAALRGVSAARPSRRHIVISTIEHHAIIDTAERLEARDIEITRVPVGRDGVVNLNALEAAVRPDTLLVSVMLANNETGVIQPLREVVAMAHKHGALVHTDAVNALGKIEVGVNHLGVDLLSLSAHKIYGPKGCGALYIRSGTPFRSILVGGPQERNRRGGTLNVPGIMGLAAACELVAADREADEARIRPLRDRMETALLERFPHAAALGHDAPRVPNTSCICFPGVEAEAVLLLLSEAGICASSGAACSSGSLEPSHVVRAMGVDPHLGQGQLRFSLGRFTVPADVDRLLEVLPQVLRKVAAVNAV